METITYEKFRGLEVTEYKRVGVGSMGNAVLEVNGKYLVEAYVDPVTHAILAPKVPSAARFALNFGAKKGDVVMFCKTERNQYSMLYNHEKGKEYMVFWRAGATKSEVVAGLGRYFVAVLEEDLHEGMLERAHEYNPYGMTPGCLHLRVRATPVDSPTVNV